MTTPVRFPSVDSKGKIRAKHLPLGARVLRPVATRPNPLGQGTQAPPAGNSVTYKAQHTVTTDCTDLRLLFGNWQFASAGGAELDGANAITVRATIEPTSGGTRRPFDFNGSRSVVVDPGGTALTEPLGYSFRKGDTLWSWTNVSIAAGTWPIGLQLGGAQAAAAGSPYPTLAAAEGSNFSANSGDVTITGAVNAAQVMNAYSPSAILGLVPSNTRAVAIIGDSIASGFTDIIAYDFGYIVRALAAANIGHLNLAHKGEAASQFVLTANSYRRKRLLPYCTDAIVNYGTNDLAQNNQTYLNIATNLVGIWQDLAQRGMPVYQTTITPRTTSTDGWTTLANQTVVPGCGQPRTDLNNWLRAGAPVNGSGAPVAVGTAGATPCPYLAGVYDVATTVEDGTSGLWKVSAVITSDGVHPNAAGHALMAPAINTAPFVAA